MRSAIQSAQLKLQAEIGKVVQSVRTEYQAARAQESSLSCALGQQKGEALAMNRKGIEYSVLERDVQSSKQIYESLMQRAKETGVSGELKSSNIRVVDEAERPRTPVTPRKRHEHAARRSSAALCWPSGWRSSSSTSTAGSRRRTKSRRTSACRPSAWCRRSTPRHGTSKQPLLARRRSAELRRGVPDHPHERAVLVRRGRLAHARRHQHRARRRQDHGGERTWRLRFAQAGQRVLLIDADMRRPRVHDVFGCKQEPGLSNVLVGNAKASQSGSQDAPCPGCGCWPPAASRRTRRSCSARSASATSCTSLKEHFDLILVDTPPVMAVTDAAIAAQRRDRRGVRRRRRDDEPARGARRGRAARAGRARTSSARC